MFCEHYHARGGNPPMDPPRIRLTPSPLGQKKAPAPGAEEKSAMIITVPPDQFQSYCRARMDVALSHESHGVPDGHGARTRTAEQIATEAIALARAACWAESRRLDAFNPSSSGPFAAPPPADDAGFDLYAGPPEEVDISDAAARNAADTLRENARQTFYESNARAFCSDREASRLWQNASYASIALRDALEKVIAHYNPSHRGDAPDAELGERYQRAIDAHPDLAERVRPRTQPDGSFGVVLDDPTRAELAAVLHDAVLHDA